MARVSRIILLQLDVRVHIGGVTHGMKSVLSPLAQALGPLYFNPSNCDMGADNKGGNA
jgi:hypothetical protein